MTRTATRNTVPPLPPFFAGAAFFGADFFGAEVFGAEALLLSGAAFCPPEREGLPEPPERPLVDFELTIFMLHRLRKLSIKYHGKGHVRPVNSKQR